MNRIKILLLLTLSFLLTAACAKRAAISQLPSIPVDLGRYQSVHIDWVDLNSEDWSLYGYGNKGAWVSDITYLNQVFQANFRQYWLKEKKLSFSDRAGSRTFPAKGLLVTFEDIRIDYNNYYLHLAITFKDLRTNKILFKLPQRPYYGNQWGFKGFLSFALDEVSQMVAYAVLKNEKPNLLQ